MELTSLQSVANFLDFGIILQLLELFNFVGNKVKKFKCTYPSFSNMCSERHMHESNGFRFVRFLSDSGTSQMEV